MTTCDSDDDNDIYLDVPVAFFFAVSTAGCFFCRRKFGKKKTT